MKNFGSKRHKGSGAQLLKISTWLVYLSVLSSIIRLPYSKGSSSARLREECMELSSKSHCHCIPILSDVQIECRVNDSKLTIKIRPGDHVMIECFNTNYKDYKFLPNMAVGNTSQVQIQGCPMPGHLSIASIPQQLGVKQYTTLLFDNDNDLAVNITRKHLSGLHGLRRLRFSSSRVLHMPPDLFFDETLRNLTWLDLRSNNVDLPVDIFSKLNNLVCIELGYNHFKSLPQGIFRNQQKLRVLNLWSNELRNLSKTLFKGITSLTDLDLSNNGMETLRHDVFKLLRNLTNISLNGNRFQSLPKGLFKYNKMLTHIRLINNRVALKSLPAELFAHLPELNEVRISCDLESVPGDLFSNSSDIETISLAGNKLGNFPAELFASQENLIDVDLSRNLIRNLPKTLFRNTRKLAKLNLQYNELSEIPKELFPSLEELKSLDLSNNKIIAIHSSAFASTQNIEELNLENNQLTLSEPYGGIIEGLQNAFGSPFQHVNRLRILNLRNNSIMSICQDWKYKLLLLEELDLSYNNISSMNDSDLQFLTRNDLQVNLTHNQLRMVNLHSIDTMEIDSKNRSIIMDFNNNPMQCDCVLLHFVQFLRGERPKHKKTHIKMISNNLQCSQPESLEGKLVRDVRPMDLLCPFDHENTNPKRCPRGCNCWVRSFDKVLVVNCSNGNLTKIPALPRIDKQELKAIELHLENNQLLELPQSDTPGYADVTKLLLSGNNLTNIDSFNLPERLTELNLQNNHLTNLHYTILQYSHSSSYLDKLYLSGNPWMCDCQSRPFFFYAQGELIFIDDFDKITCGNPPGIGYFHDLQTSYKCSDYELLADINSVLLIGLLIFSLVALSYKCRKDIKIWFMQQLDKFRKYDVFISYARGDEEFVAEHFVPRLATIIPRNKFCGDVRDWSVVDCIPKQILRFIKDSRKTIVILSQNFNDSVWAKMEFQVAYQSSLNDSIARVIVILYGDIEMDSFDEDLMAYLRLNIHLQWGEHRSWEKLCAAISSRY